MGEYGPHTAIVGDATERTQSRARGILSRGFMRANESREWGIWFCGIYSVGHFLRELGPESEIWRFATRKAADEAITGRWSSPRYVPRMIPQEKSPPSKD